MKKCITCDKELIKHKTESKKRYEKKQFCSTACSRVYMKANKIGWWAKQHSGFDDVDSDKDKEWL